MIRIRQINVNLDNDTLENVYKKAANRLRIKQEEILDLKIIKKSLDARHKPNLFYIYEVDVKVKDENKILKYNKDKDILASNYEPYKFNVTGSKNNAKIVIVGAGPAGLMASYVLAENGYKPLVIERGEDVDNRVKTVEQFFETNKLNTESNVQFGEGGAGTFSDGKLTTQVKDPFKRKQKVLETLVKAGADDNIVYINKPHIGTDKLRDIVKNMRNIAIKNGASYRYNTKLTNIITKNNELKAIEVNNKEIIECNVLILAIGHSARDTFYMLNDKINMEAKPFAVGVRVQHPQKLINKSQYGIEFHELLEAASYKLTYNTQNKRGVYSFCMCPGGYVVNASSEEGMLAINGMSNHARERENANSAIIVSVTPKDFGDKPLDGIEFQRKLEKKAYEIGKKYIPVQLLEDYKNNKETVKLGHINPIFKGKYNLANLNLIFPEYINESIKEAMDYYGNKIKGFNDGDVILAGVESRTSSPVRMERNELCESNIKGIFPCGEGAGYAGGITSSMMDGLKVSEAIAQIYNNKEE